MQDNKEGGEAAIIHGPDDATTVRATTEGAHAHKAPAGYSLIPTHHLKILEAELNDLRSRGNPHHTELTRKLNHEISRNVTLLNEMRTKDMQLLQLAETIAAYQSTRARDTAYILNLKEELKQLNYLILRPVKWLYLALRKRAIHAERRDQAERTQEHIQSAEAAKTTIEALNALPRRDIRTPINAS